MHDNSLLVFVLLAFLLGFLLGVLFLHEVQVWRYRRSLQPGRKLELPKQPKPNQRRAQLKAVP